MSVAGYLERILKARVYDVAIESPLEHIARLSARIHNRILIKREDLQPVFSFKLRGAYNKIAQLSEAERARGVTQRPGHGHADSALNHANSDMPGTRQRTGPASLFLCSGVASAHGCLPHAPGARA